jgi:hypothetical protein
MLKVKGNYLKSHDPIPTFTIDSLTVNEVYYCQGGEYYNGIMCVCLKKEYEVGNEKVVWFPSPPESFVAVLTEKYCKKNNLTFILANKEVVVSH